MTNRSRRWPLAAASLALGFALTFAPVAARAASIGGILERVVTWSGGTLGIAFEGDGLDRHAQAKLAAYRMVPDGTASALDNRGYSCSSGTVGLALGNRDRVAVLLRAGLARLSFDSWAAANRARPGPVTGAALLRALSQNGGSVLMPVLSAGLMMRF